MGDLAGREATGSEDLRARRYDRGQRPRGQNRRAARRARSPRAHLPAAFLVIGRMVFSRWGTGSSHPLLSCPSQAGTTRTSPYARSRGRDPGVVHEDPAPRGGARDRQRLQASATATAAADLRPFLHPLPGVLHAEALQQKLRSAPRQLVRAEPPGRGLRGDVCDLAQPALGLAQPLRRLAGAQEN